MDVASALAGLGAQEALVVAVHGCRSFALISSALGVLLSGKVLLLIDSTLPPERKRVMLQEAGVRLVLETAGALPQTALPRQAGARVARVDPDGRIVSAVGDQARHLAVPFQMNRPAPSQPAYVFFTSGTSARPKAVLGTHAGLNHFIHWQRTEFEIRPDDRMSQLTSPSFDVVLRELFLPLTTGALLCLPDDTLHRSSLDTVEWLARQGITVLHVVPTLAEAWLLPAGSGRAHPNLRYVFFAGEPLTGALVQRWRRRFGSVAQIINLYGPTETTLAKFFYRVEAAPLSGVQPVGRPLPDCEVYIVGRSGQLCRPQEEGEIVIRTPFRTRGYLNGGQEQAERFVVNPCREDPQDLLYFTGDLGYLGADGLLEIRGRLDAQVKIKGVRVEPAEVAAVLSENPKVRACAVIAMDVPHGLPAKVLVAYWVPAPGAPTTADRLKRYLRRRLPKEMVPAYLVAVDELPITCNGKLDLQALQSRTPQGLSPAQAAPSY
jgi:amino acid adenylation domain-containing protein